MKKYCISAILFVVVLVLSISTTAFAADYNVVQDQIDSGSTNINLGSNTYTPGIVDSVNVNRNNVVIRGQSVNSKAVFDAQGSNSRIMRISGNNVRLENLIFKNADVRLYGGAISSNGVNLTIVNCEFINNKAMVGAIALGNDSNNTLIQNCIFTNNKAAYYDNTGGGGGGAIDSHASNGRIIGCTFTNNSAIFGGGALYFIFGTNNTISGCTFRDNSAPSGGAINTGTPGTTLTISSSIFNNNKATNNGGALYSNNLLITNKNTFTSNRANANGGAIFTTGTARSTITGDKFTSNTAKNGGGIYNNAPLSISSSTFTSNKASNHGGAIYANRNLNISGGSIKSSTANNGSGIYNIATLRISKVSFSSNNAKIYGIGLSSPSQVLQGKTLTVKAFVTKGDNIINSIFTRTNDVRIDGKIVNIANRMPNKVITIVNGNKKINKRTSNTGIATYKIATKKDKNKKDYNIKISSTFSQNNKKYSKSITVKAVTKLTKTINGVSTNKTPNKSNISLYKDDMDRVAKNTKSNVTSIDSKHVTYHNKKINKDTKLYPYIRYDFVVTTNNSGKLSKKKVEVWERASTDIYFIKNVSLSKDFDQYLGDVKYGQYTGISTTSLNNKEIRTAVINILKSHNGELTASKKAELIVKWARNKIKYPKPMYWNTKKGALKTLSSKLGNCCDQAHLTVAMLRMTGVPTRYRHFPSSDPCTLSTGWRGGHVIGTAYINGKWLEFDPTSSEKLQVKLETIVSRGTYTNPINLSF